MNELHTLLTRHCDEAITRTAIPRLIISRSDTPTALSSAIYYPLLCVIAQGKKRLFLGSEEFLYDASTYIVASADLPVCGQVIEAPYIGLTLGIDPDILTSLLLEMPLACANVTTSRALGVNNLEGDLSDALLRLVRLLDEPRHIPVLAPMIEREILYHLLLGQGGGMLRQLALPASQMSRISRAINLIRTRFDQSLRVEELAETSAMSPASFHRHFRAVTNMSPLQFQKQIRLNEARRRLLAKEADAATIGFEVGYESPSQFSREYRRLFGEPPGRDVTRTRLTLAGRQEPA